MKIGSKGNLNDVDRVVKVVMYDNYYEPSSLIIKAGETIVVSGAAGSVGAKVFRESLGAMEESVMKKALGSEFNNLDVMSAPIKDGKVSLSEMRDYISKNVQKLTNGKQNPTSRRENLEYDYKIW